MEVQGEGRESKSGGESPSCKGLVEGSWTQKDWERQRGQIATYAELISSLFNPKEEAKASFGQQNAFGLYAANRCRTKLPPKPVTKLTLREARARWSQFAESRREPLACEVPWKWIAQRRAARRSEDSDARATACRANLWLSAEAQENPRVAALLRQDLSSSRAFDVCTL